jgi:hypothetical protein
VIFSVTYLLACCLLGCVMVLAGMRCPRMPACLSANCGSLCFIDANSEAQPDRPISLRF